ncbi:E3 ubiquitin-protein ligase At3g02290-like isoform X2 [Tasmannia lanceolata]|uniref:E3 ubiquitin-protein ligase At3g02290-like isoform X2 n=1 Tax=Tasmannia lanceolata TaxID=3420 RepID=UPI004062E203
MGAVCCCLHVDDLEENVHPNNPIHTHCLCLNCFVQPFLHAYNSLFHRGGVHALPSSNSATSPLASSAVTASRDSSPSATYRAPPRPLPFDVDPRCSRGLVSRHEKASGHFHEESEPLRRNSHASVESVNAVDKQIGYDYEGGSKVYRSESSMKNQSMKFMSEESYILTSSEDEDVCPTCLEEYTSENPKIMTQCSHHYHLGCIYEWMERSETCPVCGKVMVFEETT